MGSKWETKRVFVDGSKWNDEVSVGLTALSRCIQGLLDGGWSIVSVQELWFPGGTLTTGGGHTESRGAIVWAKRSQEAGNGS